MKLYPHAVQVSRKSIEIPVAHSQIPAGFPSPADDYAQNALNITDLIKRPNSTFIMHVSGDSMTGIGINDGDWLVIDRAEPWRNGSIVVACVGNEFTVKELRIHNGKYWLHPANDRYKPIMINDENTTVWGVVLYAITDLKKGK